MSMRATAAVIWRTVLESTKLGRPSGFLFDGDHHPRFRSRVLRSSAQEGKLFHPLAFTKTFAMVGATIIAVTLVPVLCTFLLGGKIHR